MKIDDAALTSYLVEHLRPLTEADPNLLANYVVALLKNNKPKKELQALCINKLFDFIGDETKTFVGNLFHALEDGTIAIRQDTHSVPNTVVDTSAAMQTLITSKAGDILESRISQVEKLPNLNSGMFSDHEEHEEDGSDDEDDDRNHKHRRRVSRSRSPNRDFQDVSVRKRNRSANNGRMVYHDGQPIAESSTDFYIEREGAPKRRPGRDQSYGSALRPAGDDNARGIARSISAFRGDGSAARLEHLNGFPRGVVGRGRGPSINMYAGRSTSYRGHSSWGAYAQFSGVTNGALGHTASLTSGIQGPRGAVVGMNIATAMPVGRPRCPDFEERGYCLRGDLCPLEHGANRIVVDDVQSLSKFNLPVALPSGRAIALGSMSNSSSSFGQYSSNIGISSMPIQETILPNLDVTSLPKGTVVASAEPDVYDPDQPLWAKEQPSDGLRKLSSFRKVTEDDGLQTLGLEQNTDKGITDGSQDLTPGQSVWTRIGRIDRGDVKSESIARNNPPQHTRALKKEDQEPQISPKKLERSYNEGDKKTSLRTDISVPDGDGPRISEKLGVSPHARWNTGTGNEKAQRTLYVGCIPNNMNKKEQLKAHFQKFGEIMDIRIPSQGDRAFVQFSRHEDAEAALKSPEAVMGNRFIRLSWAKRDSIPVSLVDGTSTTQNVTMGGSVVKIPIPEDSMKERTQFGVSHPLSEPKHKMAISTVQPSPSNVQPVVSNIAQKKQEELEHLKEELRKKQEELAQKRDEFRRKLERLSKQNVGVREEIEDIQSTNAAGNDVKEDLIIEWPVKTEGSVGDSGKRILSSLVGKGVLMNDQPNSGALKDISKGLNSTAQPSFGSTTQPSPASLRGHTAWSSIGSGFPVSSQWGALRYKLDNRTTVFRIVPPFPGGSPEISSLKEHFSHFDELVNVESEDMDKSIGSFKVTFSTRTAAELAFVQGKWYHGAVLQFTWVNPSLNTASSTNAHVKESSSSPNNGLAQKAPEESRLYEIDVKLTDGSGGGISVNEETKISERGQDPNFDAGDTSDIYMEKAPCVLPDL